MRKGDALLVSRHRIHPFLCPRDSLRAEKEKSMVGSMNESWKRISRGEPIMETRYPSRRIFSPLRARILKDGRKSRENWKTIRGRKARRNGFQWEYVWVAVRFYRSGVSSPIVFPRSRFAYYHALLWLCVSHDSWIWINTHFAADNVRGFNTRFVSFPVNRKPLLYSWRFCPPCFDEKVIKVDIWNEPTSSYYRDRFLDNTEGCIYNRLFWN